MKTLNDKLSEILNDGNIFDSDKVRKAINITNFGNQPFDVGMLVNSASLYKDIHGNVLGTKENIELYSKAESLRLFEGWEIFSTSKQHIVNPLYEGYAIFFDSDGYRFQDYTECSSDDDYTTLKIYTLNDFITLCNLAGIELQWNKQNQTIINLNLE